MTPAQVETFFATLREANPSPQTELQYSSVFELLAAVLLSAQATDVSVNKATKRLFAQAPTPQRMLELGLDAVAEHIKTIGLFRNKARSKLADLESASTISDPAALDAKRAVIEAALQRARKRAPP